MEYQLIAVEYRILKIICELDSVKVAGIRTELAEHAVTKVVQIIVQHFLLLARFRILSHMAGNLDGSVGTRLFAQGASCTLIASILITLEYQATTVTTGNMQCSLAVLGILLCRLVGEEVLEVFLPGRLHTHSIGPGPQQQS